MDAGTARSDKLFKEATIVSTLFLSTLKRVIGSPADTKAAQ